MIAAVAWIVSKKDDVKATAANSSPALVSEPAKGVASCRTDWRLCADNADLASRWSGYINVQASCKISANRMASYGTPEWPWLAFSSFRKGDSAPKTGIFDAFEPEAKFSNGFGAMVHTGVACKYDLRADKVINVALEPR